MWLNVVVVLASGWLPAGGCRSVWAWCFWWSFLPALVLVGSFCSSLFFLFRTTSQGPITSGLRPRASRSGSWMGRRVKVGTPTQETVFSGIPYVQRVHLGLSQRHCTVSWFRHVVTLQQNQNDDEFFNLGCEFEHVFLIARFVEANHHDRRGPVSRFHRSRFRVRQRQTYQVREVLLLSFIDRIPHRSRFHHVAEASLRSSRLAEGSFHCNLPFSSEVQDRTSAFVDNDNWQCETTLWAHWVHVGIAEAMSEVHLVSLISTTDTLQTVSVSVPHRGGPDSLWARVPVGRSSGLPVVLQRYSSTFQHLHCHHRRISCRVAEADRHTSAQLFLPLRSSSESGTGRGCIEGVHHRRLTPRRSQRSSRVAEVPRRSCMEGLETDLTVYSRRSRLAQNVSVAKESPSSVRFIGKETS